MKTLLSIVILAASLCVRGQRHERVIFLNNGTLTESFKSATHFIIIKEAEGKYQRLNYKMHAPLMLMNTYADSSMTMLDGLACTYREDGSLQEWGRYKNNVKQGSWYTLNDTGKVILETQYENGVLQKSVNPDTVAAKKDSTKYPDEKEAGFKGGNAALKKFLISNLDSEAGLVSVRGGSVRVAFTVDTSGKLMDVYLRKSVEYVLDREALRVVYKMPDWEPAFQNGRALKAYRIQPITFVKN